MLLPVLKQAEDWLYAEGSVTDAPPGEDMERLCALYASKDVELQGLCQPLLQRETCWRVRREELRGLLDVLDILRPVAIDPSAAKRMRLSSKQASVVMTIPCRCPMDDALLMR